MVPRCALAAVLSLFILPGVTLAALGHGDSPDFPLNTVSIVSIDHGLTAVDRLAPCFPNPFNPRTTIVYELSRPAEVYLTIYDLRGRLVSALREGKSTGAGRHAVVWDGHDGNGQPSAAGVYLCRLRAGGFTALQRLTLVK